MGIGLLNAALKQPLPMELSALFMCNILQRRQHMHFAGQASAYSTCILLFPSPLPSLEKPSLLSLLVLDIHPYVYPGLLLSGSEV